MKVTVTKVMSTNRATICTTQTEVDAYLNSINNNTMSIVEFKQEVPNEAVQEDENDIFALGYRLEGHEKKIERKATRTLVAWLNYSKQAIIKAFKVGQEVPKATLVEEYIPITKLDTKWGLDVKGNVTQEPQINPDKNLLLLYPFKVEDEIQELPIFRKIYVKLGEYVPTPKPTYENVEKGFDGVKKLGGRKTPEYQQWLNQLHAEFTGDFSKLVTAENAKSVPA